MPVYAKRAFPLNRVREHLETGPIVMLSAAHKGERGIMTMGWHMVMEFEPSLIGCYVWDANDTQKLVSASRSCVINVPTRDLADTVVKVGNSDSHLIDKFDAFGLTAVKGTKIDAPMIGECYANFECRIYDSRQAKRYNLYILEVVAAHVAPRVKNPRTLHYRGRGDFMVAGETISRRRLFRPEMLGP